MAGRAAPYAKRACAEVQVEECLVHGHHVHPRRLDGGLPVEREEVACAVDGWLECRQAHGPGSSEELERFAELERRCEESVQFRILLSLLVATDYRGISASSRMEALALRPRSGGSLLEEAARYISERFSEAEAQEASVLRIEDAASYELQRLRGCVVHGRRALLRQLDGGLRCSEEEVKQAVEGMLLARSRHGDRSEEELEAFALITQGCARSLQFQAWLSLLFEQDFMGIGASSRFAAAKLAREPGEGLRSAAAREAERRLSAEEVCRACDLHSDVDEDDNVFKSEPAREQRFFHPLYGDCATGSFIFVIKDDRLYMALKDGGMQHTSFFGARTPVQSSGWLELSAGRPVAYRRWSGHYRPGSGSEAAFREWARRHGQQVQARGLKLGPLALGEVDDFAWLGVEPETPSRLRSFLAQVIPA